MNLEYPLDMSAVGTRVRYNRDPASTAGVIKSVYKSCTHAFVEFKGDLPEWAKVGVIVRATSVGHGKHYDGSYFPDYKIPEIDLSCSYAFIAPEYLSVAELTKQSISYVLVSMAD